MVGGILLTTGGAVGLIVGSALLTSANNRYDVYCDTGTGPALCTKKNDTARATAGGVMMVVSGISLAAGIPLWIVGAKMVPVKKETEPAPTTTSARPAVLVGAGTAALRWRF